MYRESRFVNRRERNILVCAFTVLGFLMISGVWAADSQTGRLAAAVSAAVLWLVALRSWRRPSVFTNSGGLTVRGPIVSRTVGWGVVASARVGRRRVGAFQRSVLYVAMSDGHEWELGKWGIWSPTESAAEEDLLEFAKRVDAHVS
jgi:hypothetical protein